MASRAIRRAARVDARDEHDEAVEHHKEDPPFADAKPEGITIAAVQTPHVAFTGGSETLDCCDDALPRTSVELAEILERATAPLDGPGHSA